VSPPFHWPTRFFNKKIGYMAQADESLERVRPSFEAAVAEAAAAGAEGGCCGGGGGKRQPACTTKHLPSGRADVQAGVACMCFYVQFLEVRTFAMCYGMLAQLIVPSEA
jgi:hypothetical protein